MDGLDALRVVANVSCGEVAAERDALRKELIEVKAALEAVKSKAAEDAKKYEKLVWIARRDVDAVLADPEHPSRPSVVEVMAKYPLELQELIGEHADWQHGFNSGLLAASRMYMGIAIAYEEDLMEDRDELEIESDSNVPPVSERLAAEREYAVDEFPMLDT
ncbi:hypothetical protein NFJ02_14g18260 [Pycnococcus provasolii]